MSKNNIACILLVLFIVKSVRLEDTVSQNELSDSNYVSEPIIHSSSHEKSVQTFASSPNGDTWFDTAKRMLAAPAGQIVVHMAKEMISRSTGNSQILSLNLTNLLILILLKALIFAAGLIGAGNWGQYARARSGESQFIHADEAQLFIGYLALEGSGNDGCLNLAACNAPGTAKEYFKAAKAIIKSAEMFDNHSFNSTRDHSYILNQLEQSIRNGFDGAPCDTIYHCHL